MPIPPADNPTQAPSAGNSLAESHAMTKGEREDLQRLIRPREKVLKSAAKQRSAELLADFENQMGSEFSFDDDAIEADRDRRESREPRPLCRLPNGRGRHPTANVPGDFAAHRGTAAAATTSASVRRSM